MGWFDKKRQRAPQPTDDVMAALYKAPAVHAPQDEDESPEDLARQEKRAHYEELLATHRLDAALLAALAYAFERTKSKHRAKTLVQRAHSRLWETMSWDPASGVTLQAHLVGIVRSIFSTDARDSVAREEAEEAYAAQADVVATTGAASPEDEVIAAEEREHGRRRAAGMFDRMRAAFEEAKDEVNLLWLDFMLKGVEDLGEMARESGRDVKEFYRATDRRKRHVERLLEAERAERDDDDGDEGGAGDDDDEEENE
jgi:hypothetical protein